MPRNISSIDCPSSIHCFDCEHDYEFLGSGRHPGVCASCGSQAVSLSGDVQVSGVFDQDRESGRDDLDSSIDRVDVVVADETSRAITYTATSSDGMVALDLVVLGSARIKPGTDAWRPELVPDAVVAALEARGDTFVPCSSRKGPGGTR